MAETREQASPGSDLFFGFRCGRYSAIRRLSICDPCEHAGESPVRIDLMRRIEELWISREDPIGMWLSRVAVRAGSTLIHISDEDLLAALVSGGNS